MKRVMTLLGIVGFCSFAVAASAQTPAAPAAAPAKAAKAAKKEAKEAAAAATPVTGCVAAGADAKHFTLSADGKTYDLVGGAVKAHVGHKVEVTGTEGKAAKEGGNPTIKVKSVKMVAPSCS